MYGYYYLMFATFPMLFSGTYGFSTGLSGLVRIILPPKREKEGSFACRHISVQESGFVYRRPMVHTWPMAYIKE